MARLPVHCNRAVEHSTWISWSEYRTCGAKTHSHFSISKGQQTWDWSSSLHHGTGPLTVIYGCLSLALYEGVQLECNVETKMKQRCTFLYLYDLMMDGRMAAAGHSCSATWLGSCGLTAEASYMSAQYRKRWMCRWWMLWDTRRWM